MIILNVYCITFVPQNEYSIKRQMKQSTKDTIVQVAGNLFAKYGFYKTSMDEVAKVARKAKALSITTLEVRKIFLRRSFRVNWMVLNRV